MARERKETYIAHMNKKCDEMISIAVMFQTHGMYMKMRRCEHDGIRFEAVSFELRRWERCEMLR